VTWTRLTWELGLDMRYLTSGMIRNGALTTREFRVLLLPMTQAIAPDEAAAIRDALKRNDYNRLAAARDLGVHKSTLFRKIKSLGIDLPDTDGRTREEP